MGLFFLLVKIEAYLEDLAHNQWQRFVDEDGIIEIETSALLQEIEESLDLEEPIVSALESPEAVAAVNRMFADMELIVREHAEDAAEWNRARSHGIPGILRYHGLSVSDFV